MLNLRPIIGVHPHALFNAYKNDDFIASIYLDMSGMYRMLDTADCLGHFIYVKDLTAVFKVLKLLGRKKS